jgi:DNA polymerase-3 subunit beta
MKIKTDKRNIVNSLAAVSKAVPAHTTMPILTCVLVTASEDGIALMANDMEMAIRADIEGDVVESGSVALDAKTFLDIAKKLPDDEISIEVDDAFQATIKCGKVKFKLAGRGGSEFPRLPEIEVTDDVNISQFTLKEIIRQTIFSVAENDPNKVMEGELFEINGDKLKVTSLDGHRIAIREVDLRNSYQPVSVIVPGKVLMDINKIISGDAGVDVILEFSKNHIVFRFDNLIILSRLIDGKYFDISKMISMRSDTEVKIDRRSLMDAIDRASLLVREGDRKPIIVDVAHHIMTLSVTSAIGSMYDTIDVAQNGKDIKIGFNPKFILEALRAIDEDEITLYMINKTSPCVIKGDGYFYLILPVQFGGN